MRSFLRVFSIILLVVWMGVIFFFSHQTAQDSSEISGSFIEIVAEKIYPDFEKLSESEKADVVASFQFIVRKSAHAGAFALLGFFAFLTFISYTRMRYWLRVFLAAGLSLLYAASDEIHQYFVKGRSCELRDFLIDAAGITVSLLFCFGSVKVIGPWRRKTAFNPQRVAVDIGIGADELLKSVIEKHNAEIETDFTAEPFFETEISEEVPIEFENPILTKTAISVNDANGEETTTQTEEFTVYGVTDKKIETEKEMQEVSENIKEETAEKINLELPNDMQYAASAIGKVVIEVSKICDKLRNSDDPNKKELINLALGRSEVFKSQVLYIVQSEANSELKQKMIEKEKTEAFDYFDSIVAQTR